MVVSWCFQKKIGKRPRGRGDCIPRNMGRTGKITKKFAKKGRISLFQKELKMTKQFKTSKRHGDRSTPKDLTASQISTTWLSEVQSITPSPRPLGLLLGIKNKKNKKHPFEICRFFQSKGILIWGFLKATLTATT